MFAEDGNFVAESNPEISQNQNNVYMKLNCLLLVLFSFFGCVEGGTHGSIKGYKYGKTSKETLEKVISEVIKDQPNIYQDSVKGYYNDDTNYVTIIIMYNELPYKYTFRYYGNSTYWDTAKNSKIFIAYAHNSEGYGGSEGNGGVKSYDTKLRKELTTPFEQAFISKVDSVLGVKR